MASVIGCVMNNELERIWKEAFESGFRNLCGGFDEKY
jgi:hypothetical protein